MVCTMYSVRSSTLFIIPFLFYSLLSTKKSFFHFFQQRIVCLSISITTKFLASFLLTLLPRDFVVTIFVYFFQYFSQSPLLTQQISQSKVYKKTNIIVLFHNTHNKRNLLGRKPHYVYSCLLNILYCTGA